VGGADDAIRYLDELSRTSKTRPVLQSGDEVINLADEATKLKATAKSPKNSLIHLTDEAGEAGINSTGMLDGKHGIFAVPESVAGESTGLKVLTTGLTPEKTSKFVSIPESATGLFSRPTPVGPYSAWKHLGGVRYAPAGSLNMATGELIQGGSLLGPRSLIYGPDVLFWGGTATAGGLYYYSSGQEE
jgi:hypothetical protein